MDLRNIWGFIDNIGIGEIAARAAAMFVIMMVMLRLTGMRSFGKGDVFDNVLTVLLGAVLARGIVGATPFFSAVAGGITLMLIYALLSRLSFYNRLLGRVIKGQCLLLYNNGEFVQDNMKKADITRHDIDEQLRINLKTGTLEEVEKIYFERTGEISFVKKGPASLPPK